MGDWLRALDRILRGETTSPSKLRSAELDVPVGGLAILLVLLSSTYGFCMGWFAVFNRQTPEYLQVLASMLKVPALFFLTLAVTFPSLYVFNALVGSRLTLEGLRRLLMAALGVTVAVLASFGPIVAFFSITTENYPFIVLLNVLIFGIAGTLGLAFLLQTLHRLTVASNLPVQEPTPATDVAPVDGSSSPPVSTGALEWLEGHVLGRNVKLIFRCWVVLFALVGGQMSWVLRPFIGMPDQPVEWFRPRESNFFVAVWHALRAVVGLG